MSLWVTMPASALTRRCIGFAGRWWAAFAARTAGRRTASGCTAMRACLSMSLWITVPAFALAWAAAIHIWCRRTSFRRWVALRRRIHFIRRAVFLIASFIWALLISLIIVFHSIGVWYNKGRIICPTCYRNTIASKWCYEFKAQIMNVLYEKIMFISNRNI